MPTSFFYYKQEIIDFLVYNMNWEPYDAKLCVRDNRDLVKAMFEIDERVSNIAEWLHQRPDRNHRAK